MAHAKTISHTRKKQIEEALADYRTICESREASILGRKEVFLGKAKFGIFGDGKELPQVALAKIFREGDFRAGYYRDQTLMRAIGELTWPQYFAQLYAHTDVHADPSSAGRSMNGHYGTRTLDEHGRLKDLTQQKNSSSDISPTAAQIPRLVGLAYASKLFRQNKQLGAYAHLSRRGNEIAIGTIGNASTSEGHFFEAINAAGVLQIPMLISVWDDGYGISVPNEYQTTKGNISKVLSGFQRTATEKGFEIFTVRGWDYAALCDTYRKAEQICREEHVPVLVHVTELTQPLGHSTSGSHERYKSKERLAWEKEYDCIVKIRQWLLEQAYATAEELDQIEEEAKKTLKDDRNRSWDAFMEPILQEQNELLAILQPLSIDYPPITDIANVLAKTINPTLLHAEKTAHKALRYLTNDQSPFKKQLTAWIVHRDSINKERFSSHVYSQSEWSALRVPHLPPTYSETSSWIDGHKVLRECFDKAFERDPLLLILGEDVGKIGDVNQAFAGLQSKYGELRITDTGIREATIVGQGIGLALRGLRPIVEIQYLDYLLYALQTMSDDVATLQYRTKGGQKNPLIVRTRGHRLEGIWHAGSPMGVYLGALRGMLILTPRNMTQAAGLYNTLLASDDPALMIESLNGYRLKERLPDNIADFKVPVGVPEILKTGEDVTIVTYGSLCRIVMEAVEDLQKMNISCEVIDVQTLIPFDVHWLILKSLIKTNRIAFVDEDVPGGASAYMLDEVINKQGGFPYLDAPPVMITAAEHRTAYGSDGDYFSKPNAEKIFNSIYKIMQEAYPDRFSSLFE